MLKFCGGLVAVLVLMTGLQCASAAPVTYTGYSVLNEQNVSLTSASLGISNEQGGAGQITLTGTNTAGGSLVVWCIDIMHYLTGSGSLSPLGAVANNTIEALILNGTPLLANYDTSAAIQVAIWKSEYSDLVVSTSSSVLALANTYLSYVANGTWKPSANTQISVLDGMGINQSQGTVAPVPEPASILALGAGLIALGFVARRRRSHAAV